MIFTDIEKSIINTIATQDISEIKPFGYTARSVLFPKTEGALFIPEDVLIGNGYQQVLFLLARHDGGITHSLMIERIISFVSLIKFLEDNRLIYIIDGPSNKPCFYYEGYQYINIENQPVSSTSNGDTTVNDYIVNIENGIEFKYQSIIRDGYPRHYENVQIMMPKDIRLGAIDIGGNIKNELYRYINAFIYPTITLRDIINHGFKTEPERIAEESLKAANAQVTKANQTLIVAILTLISTVALPILISSINDTPSSIIKIIGIIYCAFLLIVCGFQIAKDDNTSS